jgi:hypothetical protein
VSHADVDVDAACVTLCMRACMVTKLLGIEVPAVVPSAIQVRLQGCKVRARRRRVWIGWCRFVVLGCARNQSYHGTCT